MEKPRKPRYPYQRATKAQRKRYTLWTWIHHEVPLELLTEPVKNRVRFIKTQKPAHERETRLRAMAPFTGRLPAPVRRAYAAWAKAYAAWEKAYAAWAKAYAAWEKADAAWEKADAAWEKADAARAKADAAWEKAYAAWEKADAAWEKALVDHRPAIEAAVRACNPGVEFDADGMVFPEAKRD
mgnify:CR=1 FL=1